MSEWGERDREGEKGGESRTSLRGRLRGSSTRLEHSGQWNSQRVPRHTVKMRDTNCTTRVYIMRRVRVHGHLRPMLHRATLHSIGAYRGRVDVCARNDFGRVVYLGRVFGRVHLAHCPHARLLRAASDCLATALESCLTRISAALRQNSP